MMTDVDPGGVELVRQVHGAACAPRCDHYWASVHEPDHYLYWIRQCMICHQIDWDYLDEAIRLAAEEMLNASRTTTEAPGAQEGAPEG